MITDGFGDSEWLHDDVRHEKFLLTMGVERIKSFLSEVESVFGIEVDDFDSALYVVISELKDRRNRDPENALQISRYIDRAIELGWNIHYRCYSIKENHLPFDPYKYMSSLL